MQVVEDGEDGGEHELDRGDEEEVGEGFAEEERGGGAGAMRWASRTWLRCSRVQDWLSAVMAAKSRATQSMPPAIWREMAAVGSKAMEKTTTTSSAKKSMPLMESRERHSSGGLCGDGRGRGGRSS